jgi:hypothetical protein
LKDLCGNVPVQPVPEKWSGAKTTPVR